MPVVDLEAERATLGAVLASDKALKPLLADVGLAPDHFYWDRHRDLFAAMIDLADRGQGVDVLTLSSRLGWPSGQVDEFAGQVPNIGNAASYGRRVKDLAMWRRRELAGNMLAAAAQTQDENALLEVDDLLSAPADHANRTHTVQQVRDAAVQRVESGEPKLAGVPFPFDRLNRAGGMRPGQLTVIAARQKQGKSVFVDMCVDQAAKHGVEPHLYLLEMSEEERVERFQARLALVSYSRIIDGGLTAQERVRVVEASRRIPCGMTECAGWTPREVVRHARWHGHRFIAVDHMHRFPMREEADVAECVRLFRDYAAQTGTHVILAAQLNEKRVTGQQRPRPTATDLRGSGAIAAEAHYVTFVYRPDDEKGREGDEGEIWHAMCRSGKAYLGERVLLRGEFMRFEVDESERDWRGEL